MRKIFLTFTTLLLCAQASQALEIYRTGKPHDITRPTKQVTCLAGGGDDAQWIGGWKYLMENSGGGDVVIVRADGRRGGYEDWLYKDTDKLKLPAVNSVTTVVLERRQDLNDPELATVIRGAEMIFFAGGNQTLYISWFRDSLFEKEVVAAIQKRNVPIAGTSAGMATLAGIDFTARYDSPTTGGMITAQDALNNPTATMIELDKRVVSVPVMKNVITDTHFDQRGRQGRLMGFMAKALHQKIASVQQLRAIGADEGTAFCFNQQGSGRVYGVGSVYFLRSRAAPEVLEAGQPLTWKGENGDAMDARVLKQGTGIFNIARWAFSEAFGPDDTEVQYENWTVEAGQFSRHLVP